MSHLIWPWWQVTKTYIVLRINIVIFHICLFIPKAQFKKTDFVNSRTTKAYHSLKDWGMWKSALRNVQKAPKENTYFSTSQLKKPQKSISCFYTFLFP